MAWWREKIRTILQSSKQAWQPLLSSLSFDELKDYYIVYRTYFHTIAVMGICVLLALFAFEYSQRRVQAQAQWPRAHALVLESQLARRYHREGHSTQSAVFARVVLRLRYQVDSKRVTTYLNEEVRDLANSDLDAVFVVGNIVPIRYDPEDLQSVKLHPSVVRAH